MAKKLVVSKGKKALVLSAKNIKKDDKNIKFSLEV
jgi:hypothetical protein